MVQRGSLSDRSIRGYHIESGQWSFPRPSSLASAYKDRLVPAKTIPHAHSSQFGNPFQAAVPGSRDNWLCLRLVESKHMKHNMKVLFFFSQYRVDRSGTADSHRLEKLRLRRGMEVTSPTKDLREA